MISTTHRCPFNPDWESRVRASRLNEPLFFAQNYGITSTVYEARADAHLASLISQTFLFMRVGDDHALRGILRDDLIRNQFQTGTSKGFLNPPLRQATERSLFGLALDCPHDQRPVYGYAHVIQDGRFADVPGYDPVDNYGMISLRFHEEIRHRTTITAGDSLIQTLAGTSPTLVASPINAPSYLALLTTLGTPLQYPDATALVKRVTSPQLTADLRVGYLEAQYHHGIRRSDIECVYFNGRDPEEATLSVLNNYQIEWERLW